MQIFNETSQNNTEKEIIDFINGFKKGYEEALENVFLYGYCYYFSEILKIRFNGEVYYMPIDNHFITRIANNYYDIRGKLNENQYTPCVKWEEYKFIDKLEVSRIYRDCIRKERL